MEEMNQIEVKLWEYIDGSCSSTEQDDIAMLIATDRQWKDKYEELLSLNDVILKLETEEPSVRFTKNVMEMVGDIKVAPSIQSYVNPNIIKGIAAFFLVSILLTTGYALFSVNWQAGHAATLPEFHLPQIVLPKWQAGNYFNSTAINIIIGANILIGLLFIDTLLRKKDKKRQHQ